MDILRPLDCTIAQHFIVSLIWYILNYWVITYHGAVMVFLLYLSTHNFDHPFSSDSSLVCKFGPKIVSDFLNSYLLKNCFLFLCWWTAIHFRSSFTIYLTDCGAANLTYPWGWFPIQLVPVHYHFPQGSSGHRCTSLAVCSPHILHLGCTCSRISRIIYLFIYYFNLYLALSLPLAGLRAVSSTPTDIYAIDRRRSEAYRGYIRPFPTNPSSKRAEGPDCLMRWARQ